MIKLEDFHYIREIERSGSISKAAIKLFVSQPYLSVVLKNLEDEVGAKIFRRTNKGVEPTTEGKMLLEYAKEIDDILTKVKSIGKLNAYNNNNLSIASMYSFTMLDLYIHFSNNDDYEDCNIKYEEMPNNTIPSKVEKGEVDIGVVYMSSVEEKEKIEEFRKLGLEFFEFTREPLYIVVGDFHPLASKESVTLKEVNEYPLVIERNINGNKNSGYYNNPFPGLFKNKSDNTLTFDNNRSLMYFLTKSKKYISIGQKCLNLSNPFVINDSIKYIPIKDIKEELITGYLINDSIDSTNLQERFIDYTIKFFNNYIDSNLVDFEKSI